MEPLRNMAALLRPGQWPKNVFVLAPLLFARAVAEPGQAARALAAFGLFCLAASAVYAANDVIDAPRDRLHPRKKARPVASGAVAPALA
ncbi:MAG: decaprenyl-phosphate phosphoribosyltransferase, partial [Acidobacteria bacterium ACB2]|nr:decaprenyl-phosphate phosphoribosyltransferase [Acidobacteria bacterium ACB2]